MQQLSGLLAELQAISPMPGDEELEEQPQEGMQRLNTYAHLIKAIRQEVQVMFPLEVIPILLNSFGLGDGGEVYWSTVHLLETYPDDKILYHFIQKGCRSSYPGTRKWCCLLLGRRRSLEDLSFFLERLKDEVSTVCAEALLYGIGPLAEIYALPQVIPAVIELFQHQEPEIQDAAREILDKLQAANNP